MKTKQWLAILVTLALGVGATTFALKNLKPQMAGAAHGGPGEPAEEEVEKGPHRGRMLRDGNFALEVSIFERGVPPEFRVYATQDGRPIDPASVTVNITLNRLGGRVDQHQFRAQGEYLLSNLEVYEPHSFDVSITASHLGKSYKWNYGSPEFRTEIKPEAMKSGGIVIATAGPARIRGELNLPGEVRLNPERTAAVTPRFDGVVIDVRKSTGDKVIRGEVMAVIENRELAGARGDYLESLRRVDLAGKTFQREQTLWKKKISPEQDYLAARLALDEARIRGQTARQKLSALGLSGTELDSFNQATNSPTGGTGPQPGYDVDALARFEIRAPLAGTVIERSLVLGQTVSASDQIFRVADLSTVWVELTLYQRDLSQAPVGARTTVSAVALDLNMDSEISYISPILSETSRSALARVVLPNPEGAWRPGLTVRAKVTTGETEAAVAVPLSAVQTFRDWQVVFLKEGNFFEPTVIETGRRDSQHIEILSGLKPGQTYAAEGSFLVKADILKSGASHDH